MSDQEKMAKVVQGRFGGKNTPEQKQEPESEKPLHPSKIDGTLSLSDIENALGVKLPNAIKSDMEKKLEVMDKAIRIAEKVENYVRSLINFGPIANEVLAAAEREWKHKSLEELIVIAENSDEAQWSKYPGRFMELARALRKKSY